MTEMPDLEPLVCVDCVAQVDATSPEAAGWVMVERSVLAGYRSDDKTWVCPACSTATERAAFLPPLERLTVRMWPDDAA
jgi:hypothetical protein